MANTVTVTGICICVDCIVAQICRQQNTNGEMENGGVCV